MDFENSLSQVDLNNKNKKQPTSNISDPGNFKDNLNISDANKNNDLSQSQNQNQNQNLNQHSTQNSSGNQNTNSITSTNSSIVNNSISTSMLRPYMPSPSHKQEDNFNSQNSNLNSNIDSPLVNKWRGIQDTKLFQSPNNSNSIHLVGTNKNNNSSNNNTNANNTNNNSIMKSMKNSTSPLNSSSSTLTVPNRQSQQQQQQQQQLNSDQIDRMAEKWLADLEDYQSTLEDMTAASSDKTFKDELLAIEQWFTVLSETERTATLYTLLRYSNKAQIRFFITVLQQMSKSDPVLSVFSPLNFEKDAMQNNLAEALAKSKNSYNSLNSGPNNSTDFPNGNLSTNLSFCNSNLSSNNSTSPYIGSLNTYNDRLNSLSTSNSSSNNGERQSRLRNSYKFDSAFRDFSPSSNSLHEGNNAGAQATTSTTSPNNSRFLSLSSQTIAPNSGSFLSSFSRDLPFPNSAASSRDHSPWSLRSSAADNIIRPKSAELTSWNLSSNSASNNPNVNSISPHHSHSPSFPLSSFSSSIAQQNDKLSPGSLRSSSNNPILTHKSTNNNNNNMSDLSSSLNSLNLLSAPAPLSGSTINSSSNAGINSFYYTDAPSSPFSGNWASINNTPLNNKNSNNSLFPSSNADLGSSSAASHSMQESQQQHINTPSGSSHLNTDLMNSTAMKLAALSTVNNRVILDSDVRKFRRKHVNSEGLSSPSNRTVGNEKANFSINSSHANTNSSMSSPSPLGVTSGDSTSNSTIKPFSSSTSGSDVGVGSNFTPLRNKGHLSSNSNSMDIMSTPSTHPADNSFLSSSAIRTTSMTTPFQSRDNKLYSQIFTNSSGENSAVSNHSNMNNSAKSLKLNNNGSNNFNTPIGRSDALKQPSFLSLSSPWANSSPTLPTTSVFSSDNNSSFPHHNNHLSSSGTRYRTHQHTASMPSINGFQSNSSLNSNQSNLPSKVSSHIAFNGFTVSPANSTKNINTTVNTNTNNNSKTNGNNNTNNNNANNNNNNINHGNNNNNNISHKSNKNNGISSNQSHEHLRSQSSVNSHTQSAQTQLQTPAHRRTISPRSTTNNGIFANNSLSSHLSTPHPDNGLTTAPSNLNFNTPTNSNIGNSNNTSANGTPGSGARRTGSRPPEDPTDPELLADIPVWLRSLRLHKYSDNLKDLFWWDLIKLNDSELEARGVNALGARRKMLKVFEQVQEAVKSGKLVPGSNKSSSKIELLSQNSQQSTSSSTGIGSDTTSCSITDSDKIEKSSNFIKDTKDTEVKLTFSKPSPTTAV